jgi:hypothetical protein
MRVHRLEHKCWSRLQARPTQSCRLAWSGRKGQKSLPEDIGSHDENTTKHLGRHIDSITFSFQLLLFGIENHASAQTGSLQDLIRGDSGVSTGEAEITNLERTSRRNEDIGGFDIEMNHAIRVDMVDTLFISLCLCWLDQVLTSESSRTIFHTLASSRRSTTLPYSSKKNANDPRHNSVWINNCRFCSQASSNLMTWG